jgi:23S rRNA G2445 N2-methylase RlmL
MRGPRPASGLDSESALCHTRGMSFEVERALADPGFTPGARHLPLLFDRLSSADDETSEELERVIARAGSAALAHVTERLAGATRELRRRLLRLTTRLPSSDERTELLLEALRDEDATSRRWAARGLGQLPAPDERVELALLEAFEGADLPLKRAIAESLGKVGSPRSRDALAAASGDPELERRARRSLLLLERASVRLTRSAIRLDAELPKTVRVVARSRAGLSELVAEELSDLAPHVTSPSSVTFDFGGNLRTLYRSRIATDFGVVVAPARPLSPTPEALAELVTSPPALEIFRAWTSGPVRFRLEFASGGHRRSEAWRVAELVSKRCRELLNDTREAPWEVLVGSRFERDGLLLVPRGADERFAYRTRDVPAASHPTVAAALARVARSEPDDVVWDPFVGSGLELVERARLGPYRRLLGSDLDPRALAAAHSNLKSAGITATLERGDSLALAPREVSLILTNPPMGRRVARDGTIRHLLTSFVVHASRVLVRGGRMVWLSPLPDLTLATGRQAGFRTETITTVDMQGFEAALQIFRLD